jgi:hypothetical protein
MKLYTVLAVALVLVIGASASAMEMKSFQMKEDFGTEPLYNCYLNYYYYIPCPTSSWFWSMNNWPVNSVVGEMFTIGDPSMFTSKGCPPYTTCDPLNAHQIEQIRVLDFAGYGTLYPGLYTVNFQIWCSDERGCPVGPALWSSGPKELCAGGWNYVLVTPPPGQPPICVTKCKTVVDPPSYPRILVTAKMIGSSAIYPQWGFDNIASHANAVPSCAMHDYGCCPALYPRPYVSHYNTIHSGYYGVDFVYCPPQWFLDGADSVGDVYGFIELAWRVYLVNSGPTATQPSTWGHIKSMYR